MGALSVTLAPRKRDMGPSSSEENPREGASTLRLPSLLGQVWVLMRKEILVELRSKEITLSMAAFAVAALVTFQFAFDLRGATLLLVAPGVLWVAILFAGMLGLGRSFAREVERGSLEGLLASPVDRGAIYLAKMLATTFFLLFLGVLIVPVASIFFNLDLFHPALLVILPLGAMGFAAAGTTFAAMAANTRAREALLPVLLLPLLVPVIIASVKGTALIVDGRPWEDIQIWVGILVTYDVVFTTLSFLTFSTIVEE